MDGLTRWMFGILLCSGTLFAQPKLNLVFYGDSLTQGFPHLNGETDTYPFKVSQQFVGSTYTRLGSIASRPIISWCTSIAFCLA